MKRPASHTNTSSQFVMTILLLLASLFNVRAQIIQLHYSGKNKKIVTAVAEANRILKNPDFYKRIDTIQ